MSTADEAASRIFLANQKSFHASEGSRLDADAITRARDGYGSTCNSQGKHAPALGPGETGCLQDSRLLSRPSFFILVSLLHSVRFNWFLGPAQMTGRGYGKILSHLPNENRNSPGFFRCFKNNHGCHATSRPRVCQTEDTEEVATCSDYAAYKRNALRQRRL